MKALVVEYAFDSYSKGKYRSAYDAVDGISYTPRQIVAQGALAGDAAFELDVMLDEAIHQYRPVPQCCSHHAQLDPEVAEQVRRLGRQLSGMSDDFENSDNRRLSIPGGTTAIQFQQPYDFVKSAAGNVEITVVRTGNSTSEQAVAWRTRDCTAKAGEHYVRAEGIVTFQPGETQKVIQVQLIADHEDNTINFKVDLVDTSANSGSVITYTVNIVDYDDLSTIVKRTILHIIKARPTIADVKNTLSEKTTIETFKAALLLLWSNTASLQWELRVAFDLLKFALPHVPYEHLMPFVTQYFENAPELDEVLAGMHITSNDSDSEMSENSNSGSRNSYTSEEDSDLD